MLRPTPEKTTVSVLGHENTAHVDELLPNGHLYPWSVIKALLY
jgi:hypothetical protein